MKIVHFIPASASTLMGITYGASPSWTEVGPMAVALGIAVSDYWI